MTEVFMRRILLLFCVSLLLFFPAGSNGEMTVRHYMPSRHFRFYDGSDKHFVGSSYNFSGVGSASSGRWATLVTDNCFLSAFHLHPEVGDKVTFWSSDNHTGPSYSYTVAGGVRIGKSDLWVGWFDKSVIVNPAIARYPVAMLRTVKGYLGLEMYNYGVNHRVGRNVLDGLSMTRLGRSKGVAVWYDYDDNDVPSVGGDETYLRSGDSGAPSFAIFNSRLALIGIHWMITNFPVVDGVRSSDTFVPAYFDQINKVLAKRSQSLCRY